jgi:hypothetical protein
MFPAAIRAAAEWKFWRLVFGPVDQTALARTVRQDLLVNAEFRGPPVRRLRELGNEWIQNPRKDGINPCC